MLNNRPRVVALQVQREAKPFQCPARLDFLDCSLKRVTGRRCVARTQCGPALFDHGRAHQPDDGTLPDAT
jgi:hypothetical protein